ncbi:unnamed protein product [Natator depressus]
MRNKEEKMPKTGVSAASDEVCSVSWTISCPDRIEIAGPPETTALAEIPYVIRGARHLSVTCRSREEVFQLTLYPFPEGHCVFWDVPCDTGRPGASSCQIPRPIHLCVSIDQSDC